MPQTVSGSWSTCESTKPATCTSPFRKRDARYSRSRVVPLRRPCADAGAIVSATIQDLHAIFQLGFNVAKVGVILTDLQQAAEGPLELSLEDDERDRSRLMQALDVINDRRPRAQCAWAPPRPGARRTAVGRRSRDAARPPTPPNGPRCRSRGAEVDFTIHATPHAVAP